MRPAVQRDDAGIVDHLGMDDDESRALEDLIVVVIGLRKHHVGNAPSDASFPQVSILRIVGGTARLPRLRPRGLALLGFSGQRGHSAVRRVHDEGRPPGGDDARSAVPPEIVIRTGDIRVGASVAAIAVGARECLPFELGGFGLGEKFFARHIGGPLERRDCCGRPDTLEIGMTPRRARRTPRLCAGRRGGPRVRVRRLPRRDTRRRRNRDRHGEQTHERWCTMRHERIYRRALRTASLIWGRNSVA